MSDAIKEWVTEWSERFDQKITEEEAASWFGKKVSATGEANVNGVLEARGFEGKVIGYTKTVVGVEGTEERAQQISLVTDEGLSFAIISDMRLEEVSE